MKLTVIPGLNGVFMDTVERQNGKRQQCRKRVKKEIRYALRLGAIPYVFNFRQSVVVEIPRASEACF